MKEMPAGQIQSRSISQGIQPSFHGKGLLLNNLLFVNVGHTHQLKRYFSEIQPHSHIEDFVVQSYFS